MTKYFTSDWHLNETRIGDFNPFFRPFKSVEEQNETIIGNLNQIVRPSDELIVLGDVAMDEQGVKLLDRIKCENRTLIVGNYDEDKLEQLAPYFGQVREDMDLRVGEVDCYLNHYPTKHVDDRFNITGHIHGLWKVKPNMVNVGVDAWHFRPVSEEEILFVHNAIQKGFYDENVFVHCK
ncbi:hypothetical protein GOV12_05635 [Candidatus Pacearchaeota archaeon]|nr:hypothetical protein [Candidatus Pacearchaeota archaeon]